MERQAPKQLLTLAEASEFLRLSRSTIYKLTHHRRIPFVKLNGGKVLFDLNDLIAWVEKKKKKNVEDLTEGWENEKRSF